MNKLILIALVVLILSSCTVSRGKYGCPGQGSGLGFVGYK
jgi:hypothetical protein